MDKISVIITKDVDEITKSLGDSLKGFFFEIRCRSCTKTYNMC